MDLLMVVLENMRDEILDEVKNIEPVDETERLHIDDVLSWIQGPSDIFRIAKPDNPPKHLVSYFVVYDPRVQKLMLIDHVKANMWLPSGGHVEIARVRGGGGNEWPRGSGTGPKPASAPDPD